MGRGPDILWRRLDLPGHDTCRIWQDGDRQGLEGAAVWRDAAGPAHMSYQVTCDGAWVTRSVRVQGRVGGRELTLSVHRNDMGIWHVAGEERPEFHGLQDIDLGFTPATNTLPIRRMRKTGAQAAQVAAVWLDGSDWRLKRLAQDYRRDGEVWHYAAAGYAAALAVDADGFVTDYPGLWIKEDGNGRP